jgi:molybdopterin synthase sulfur carrier subunit
MARVRLFGPVREAAGRGADVLPGRTVEEVLVAARARYGEPFTSVAAGCAVWVNGASAAPSDPIADSDELALLPPVSGG